MEKIKFKNAKKYKGIVEKVLVKEGQPVKKDEVLALISTQLEKFEIVSTIEGVIRNIYVIESLIVSHGDTVFDIFSEKEINSLLKKPSNINDTLKDGLNEFGYLEKLINEPSEEKKQQYNETIKTDESLTEEISSLEYLKSGDYEEVGVTKSFDQINEDFKINSIEEKFEAKKDDRKYIEVSESLTEEISSLDFLNIKDAKEVSEKNAIDEIVEDFINESNNDSDKFEAPVFTKSENTLAKLDIKPITVSDSITEELAINHALVFEDEKDKEIFLNHDPKVSETQVLEKLSKHKFLSKFTPESEGRAVESGVLETENKEQEDLKIEENKEVIENLRAEINKEKEELEKRVEADKEGFNHEGPKFDYLYEFHEEKIEELENQIHTIKEQEEELEFKIKDIDSKINQFGDKLKKSTQEVDMNQFEDKFKEVSEKVSSFISNTKEESSKTISSLLAKVEEKIKKLDEKIKEVSAMPLNQNKNGGSITEKTVVVDKTNVGHFSFKLDITALISLQTLMIEPLQEQGADLELNAFYVKALKKTLSKFNELDSNNSLVRLIKTNGVEFKDTVVKVQEDSSILNISKEIEKNESKNNEEVKVAIYDLSNFGIDNASFGLSKESLISIYISSIANSFKEDGNLSNFVKVNFAFNQNVLEPEDAIVFGKEFISILKNPGFLI
ncbi:biotin/lipoyl-containing protein [Spiroplasma monobiae]|uniref:Lipoyl-binding domain-containing protein n=1 Tax=Spiroplasma monobiae MQ-1 TaxID=1336748 RepID=A0A2K9LV31_SPISQ|nr:biotin/lipoyl-containing protein [Spiroplasma monobiae]AUM62880.1 hypothetical protein SMONO_v1c06310 [Spiroplasma monobiae MQ-1]